MLSESGRAGEATTNYRTMESKYNDDLEIDSLSINKYRTIFKKYITMFKLIYFLTIIFFFSRWLIILHGAKMSNYICSIGDVMKNWRKSAGLSVEKCFRIYCDSKKLNERFTCNINKSRGKSGKN